MKSNNITRLNAILIILIALVAAGIVFEIARTHAPSTAVDLSEPASLALVSVNGGNTAAVGEVNHIQWTSTNYGPADVSISVVKQVGSNPNRYELERVIATSTPNTGDAAWTPTANDVSDNTYVQIGCTISTQACTASPLSVQPLAVR